MIAVASGSGISIWTLKFSATDQERVLTQRVARLTSLNEEVKFHAYFSNAIIFNTNPCVYV